MLTRAIASFRAFWAKRSRKGKIATLLVMGGLMLCPCCAITNALLPDSTRTPTVVVESAVTAAPTATEIAASVAQAMTTTSLPTIETSPTPSPVPAASTTAETTSPMPVPPLEISLETDVADHQLIVTGNINLPDGALLTYEIKHAGLLTEVCTSKPPEHCFTDGQVEVRSESWLISEDLSEWPEGDVEIWVAFQTIMGTKTSQPPEIIATYGPLGENITGPQATAAGPLTRAEITTSVNIAASAVTKAAPKQSESQGARMSFADGTWRVGVDIEAGTYYSVGSSRCYWERLRDFSGNLQSIIANDNPRGPSVVTVKSTDAGFSCRQCGTWVLADTVQPAEVAKEFSDGTWRVGVDIAPGTYRTEGTENCYWQRTSDFGGEMNAIIANDNARGPAVVTIAPADAGFTCVRCGTWVLLE